MSAGPQTAATAVHAPCAACGAPLADDQRYCLNCGEVREGMRRALAPQLRVPSAAGAAEPAWRTSPATLLAGLACLLLAMGVGVLIGRGGGDATQPPPVTVAAPSAASAAAFKGDWPAGREGWTVALVQLPAATADAAAVARAKQDAAAKGAADVGALDSGAYPSLTAGSYVVYSGVLDDEAAANAARARLAAKFPQAQVLRIGAAAATTGAAAGATSAAPSRGSSPSSAAKKSSSPATSGSGSSSGGGDTSKAFEESKKAPTTVGTGGKPPPIDDKPAAGGGSFEDIG